MDSNNVFVEVKNCLQCLLKIKNRHVLVISKIVCYLYACIYI